MKVNEVPEKIFLERRKETNKIHHLWGRTPVISPLYEHIEYIRKDTFIKKAKEWFKQQSEYFDFNGIRRYGLEDFVDFLKCIQGD